MSIDNNIWNLAEAYVSGALPGNELTQLQAKMAADPVYKAEFQESINMLRALKDSGSHKNFRAMLQDVHKETAKSQPQETVVTPTGRTIPLKTHYWRTAAIAAGMALLTSLSTVWAVRNMNGRMNSQYSLLRRDLETYKRSQNQIISNINDQKKPALAPAKYGGTGFALSNDGYLVTNYHVTEGADSVYIQTRDGQYYKASVVGFDQKADIAILAVEDKSFRFGKGEIPYTFASSKKGLGSRVYTLGFPQEDIVYNEGYISAKNGFRGDSIQYRLELPANPGQSGAPVLDKDGSVIGLITGKESESAGTTYAVTSKALLDLVSNIHGHNIRLPKVNKLGKLNREQQVQKLEVYTCSVKVYK
ncbi:MAG: serine protease [Sphingobacteriales bacterium]|nr:MAG: serine protease [Sphingobacteriales bacterium]